MNIDTGAPSEISQKAVTEKCKPKKHSKRIFIPIILLICAALLLFGYYENHHLTVTEYTVSRNDIPSDFQNYRIVQLSDLHNARFGTGNNHLLAKVKGLLPDIIVLTGDIVDSNHTNLSVATDLCANLVDICPVYYVTGNHEYWLKDSDQETLFQRMNKIGISVLDNKAIVLSKNTSQIHLTGLDDRHLNDGTLRRLISSQDNGAFQLVLAHEPQYLDIYAQSGANLVLSGHAHGGQFILPFIGPLVAPDQGFFPTYTQGLHSRGNTQMIISRGLGNSIIPLRLFNDPEIVCITLQKEDKP